MCFLCVNFEENQEKVVMRIGDFSMNTWIFFWYFSDNFILIFMLQFAGYNCCLVGGSIIWVIWGACESLNWYETGNKSIRVFPNHRADLELIHSSSSWPWVYIFERTLSLTKFVWAQFWKSQGSINSVTVTTIVEWKVMIREKMEA